MNTIKYDQSIRLKCLSNQRDTVFLRFLVYVFMNFVLVCCDWMRVQYSIVTCYPF